MVQRHLNLHSVIKTCRSPCTAESGSRKQNKKRYGVLCSLFSWLWKIMSVYWVLSCFRVTHWSADVDWVQVGWVVGLTALAGCHCGRHAVRGVHWGDIPAAWGLPGQLPTFCWWQVTWLELFKKVGWRGKNTIMAFLELCYVLLLRLVLVTRWNGRSSWGSLLVSWEDQGTRLTSCFLNAVA